VRTTLNIDDAALAAALDATPGKTETAVINDALREYARRKRLRGLRLFAGKVRWEGNLDALRMESPFARRSTASSPLSPRKTAAPFSSAIAT
jgi:Arc/MetJ family transcription regulator